MKNHNIVFIVDYLPSGSCSKQPWFSFISLAAYLSQQENLNAYLLTSDKSALDQISVPSSTIIYTFNHIYTPAGLSAPVLRCLSELQPHLCIFLSGLLELRKKKRYSIEFPSAVVLANQRYTIKELLRLRPYDIFEQPKVLLNLFVQSLLPSCIALFIYRRAGSPYLIYFSKESYLRHSALGLPPGSVFIPDLKTLPNPLDPVAVPLHTQKSTSSCKYCYFGPPLRTRGLYSAVDYFERTHSKDSKSSLLLLVRSHGEKEKILASRLQHFIASKPEHIRASITVVVKNLSKEEFRFHTKYVDAFLLPFKVVISDFPLVIAEACLSGKPVFTMKTPGITELSATFNNLHFLCNPGRFISSTANLRAAAKSQLQELECIPLLSLFANDSKNPMKEYRYGVSTSLKSISLVGPDGVGKTTISTALATKLSMNGCMCQTRWSRYHNYISKPFLAFLRLTNISETITVNGKKYRKRNISRFPIASKIFIALQCADIYLVASLRRFWQSNTFLVRDRNLLDTIIDVAVDSGYHSLIYTPFTRGIYRLIKSSEQIIVVLRSHNLTIQMRPDVLEDKDYTIRRDLYYRLASFLDLPIVVNDDTIDSAIENVLRIVSQ